MTSPSWSESFCLPWVWLLAFLFVQWIAGALIQPEPWPLVVLPSFARAYPPGEIVAEEPICSLEVDGEVRSVPCQAALARMPGSRRATFLRRYFRPRELSGSEETERGRFHDSGRWLRDQVAQALAVEPERVSRAWVDWQTTRTSQGERTPVGEPERLVYYP